jgi:hypothetical protein
VSLKLVAGHLSSFPLEKFKSITSP